MVSSSIFAQVSVAGMSSYGLENAAGKMEKLEDFEVKSDQYGEGETGYIYLTQYLTNLMHKIFVLQ